MFAISKRRLSKKIHSVYCPNKGYLAPFDGLTTNLFSHVRFKFKNAKSSNKLETQNDEKPKIDNTSDPSQNADFIQWNEKFSKRLTSFTSENLVFDHKKFRYKDLALPSRDKGFKGYTLELGPEGIFANRKIQSDRHGEDLSDNTPFLQESGKEVLVGLESEPECHSRRILRVVHSIVKREKGEDVVVIDIQNKTNWVANIFITTAMSPRHALSIAKTIKMELRNQKLGVAKIERNEGDEWVMVSTGTIAVQLMTKVIRDSMDLERLWVLKRSIQETFEFDEIEEKFMYDEEDEMWREDEDS